jgi:hypothetical protein
VRVCHKLLSQMHRPLPIYCVDICDCGYFAGDDTVCVQCGCHRFHIGTTIPILRCYYLPVRARIELLLRCPLRNLLKYPELRIQHDDDDVYDIFDTKEYESLLARVPTGHKLICICLCWDGALLFNTKKTKSMWPLTYYIFNLPPCLRTKMHLGMHLAFLDSGSKVSCNIFAMELDDMWVNPIDVDGTLHHVAVLGEVFDGRGFEKWNECQGGGSIAGCPKCINFPGTSISRGCVTFEGMRRNLPVGHRARRQSRGVHQQDTPYYATACNEPPTSDRSFADYLRDGALGTKQRPVNGVKGLSPTSHLSYAADIIRSFDGMHAIYNLCILCLNILRPHTYNHPNRTMKQNVLDYEATRGRFQFVNRSLGGCWILDQTEADECDSRLDSVHSVDNASVPQNIFCKLGSQNSHSVITFCTLYARHCLHGLGSQPHTNCILDLFDIVRITLTEPRNKQFICDIIVPAYVELVVKFEVLFPISECTYAFHQMFHVVKDLFPVRMLWMFPFERYLYICMYMCLFE